MLAGSDSPAPKRDTVRANARPHRITECRIMVPSLRCPPPNGRVSTGCSASRVLRLRELYLPPPRAHSKLIGRYGALLPLFRLVGVPCIAAFQRVKSLLCHHSDRPKLANR